MYIYIIYIYVGSGRPDLPGSAADAAARGDGAQRALLRRFIRPRRLRLLLLQRRYELPRLLTCKKEIRLPINVCVVFPKRHVICVILDDIFEIGLS